MDEVCTGRCCVAAAVGSWGRRGSVGVRRGEVVGGVVRGREL